MTNKMLCAAWMCMIIVLMQSEGLKALAPPLTHGSSDATKEQELEKRSWWTWSTQDGYRSGSGNTPPPQSNPDNGQPDSYSRASIGIHLNPQPVSSSQGSYGRPAKTPTYKGPKIHTDGSEIQQWLKFHNKFRAQYKAAPLKWNPALVAASKRLTDTCVWRHTQNNEYGENMSAGQSSIEEVVTGWVTGPEEKDSYTGGNTEPSHFTQVVWQATTEVGCYKSVCKDVRGANLPQSPVTFWACNYNPAGNVIGEIAQNVKAAPGGRPL
ncbi:uncharacterized protein PGTG_16765 [Puccinia graminis f. sp. tritici CRL 75-36-700-3]|uniref:SCP domain-containing protein n=1 Tax=Puccinia graminis f. sp. tritici (strain CRL 75-36-700-3 / race SCCL) TaxID=418459 RepID=E3L2F2_PUCGT|nr:uncharacterized protein PGTG_16765 [Puccinia graminis f. sp. tritici CRL 75-36-700-3]EFP90739.1 hypothetical protein PGTG_16765 [Puccinia graminis f. sp. tritici CRL 75-36-700-3]